MEAAPSAAGAAAAKEAACAVAAAERWPKDELLDLWDAIREEQEREKAA